MLQRMKVRHGFHKTTSRSGSETESVSSGPEILVKNNYEQTNSTGPNMPERDYTAVNGSLVEIDLYFTVALKN